MLKQKVTAMMLAFAMMFSVSVPVFAERKDNIETNGGLNEYEGISSISDEVSPDYYGFPETTQPYLADLTRMGYDIKYNDYGQKIWILRGYKWGDSKRIIEGYWNRAELEKFQKYIDNAEDDWDSTMGYLWSAGEGAVITVILYFTPEAVFSKYKAAAVLTSAGASLGVAYGAGGYYWSAMNNYAKAKRVYDGL